MKYNISKLALFGLILLSLTYIFITIQKQPIFNGGLNDILPKDHQISKATLIAEEANDQLLNQQIFMMIGNKNMIVAEQDAKKVAELWQENSVFDVDLYHFPDLSLMAEMTKPLLIALLPYQQYQILNNTPQKYFEQLTEAISNPFSPPALLSLNDDPMGLSRFLMGKIQNYSQLQWQENTGLLTTLQDDIYWIAIKIKIKQPDFIQTKVDFIQQLKDSHQLLQPDSQMLATGGALFAQSAQISAEKDSKLLGFFSIALIACFLLLIFRQFRIIFIMIPVFVGILFGMTATLLCFGEIHLLSLVISTSIVGILVDFPLHWLSASLIKKNWQARTSLKDIQHLFFLGAFITGIGYLLLIFAPLTILQQTAIFSFFALIGALWSTLTILPTIFKTRNSPIPSYQKFIAKLQPMIFRLKRILIRHQYLSAIILLILLSGILKAQWTDNIRSWIQLDSQLLTQATKITQISGYQPSSQFLLINDIDDNALWEKTEELTEQLDTVKGESFQNYTALTQWVLSPKQQRNLQKIFQNLQYQPKIWQALQKLNIPDDFILKGISDINQMPIISYQEATQLPLAEAYKNIYLGKTANHQVSTIIRFDNLKNTQAIVNIAQHFENVHFIDRVQRINQLFEHTRLQAILFKLLSFLIVAVLLIYFFNIKKTISIIAVPIISALLTISMLAYANVTIGVFPIFALLLVSAIGIDFAIFAALKPQNHQAETLLGILLSLITTFISFGLLTISDTPVIRDFGLTIVVGIFFNAMLACLLFKNNEIKE